MQMMQFGIYQICFFQTWSYNSFIFQTNCFFCCCFVLLFAFFCCSCFVVVIVFVVVHFYSLSVFQKQLFADVLQKGPSNLQLYEKRHQHKCFPVKFTKILKTGILKNSPGGCFWSFATHDFILWLLWNVSK